MRKYILIGIISVLFIGCASNQPKEDDYNGQLEYGKTLLEKKKYLKAQTIFQSLVMKASHTDIGDEVLFYLGESYFLNKEYLLAIAEYDRLSRRMGFSSFVEKARWRICESYVFESPKYYHDQSYTQHAIDKLQEFMEEYPDSEFRSDAHDTISDLRIKLATKVYETGILYMKLGAYDSAIVSFEELLNQYYDTPLVKDSHQKIIESYCKLPDLIAANEYYDKTNSQFDKETKEEIKLLLLKTEKKLSRKK